MIRTLLFSFLLATASIVPVATAANAAQPAGLQTVTLSVENMTCSMCPITVRKSLEKVPGVVDAKADYATRTARVTYDPYKTDIQTLTEATANAGYPSALKPDDQ